MTFSHQIEKRLLLRGGEKQLAVSNSPHVARHLAGGSERSGWATEALVLTDSRIRFKYHCKSTADLAVLDGDLVNDGC